MTAMRKDFIISRVFDAPRKLLWECFADPQRMKYWWGPRGFTVVHSKMDLRVGGTYHYGMTAPNGTLMWGLFTYREIVPQEKLVFINSFRTRRAASPAIPAMKNGRSPCSRPSPLQTPPAARPSSSYADRRSTPRRKNSRHSTPCTTA
jgi:uncharacterized protein YndB with AHSA1/START domain